MRTVFEADNSARMAPDLEAQTTTTGESKKRAGTHVTSIPYQQPVFLWNGAARTGCQ